MSSLTTHLFPNITFTVAVVLIILDPRLYPIGKPFWGERKDFWIKWQAFLWLGWRQCQHFLKLWIFQPRRPTGWITLPHPQIRPWFDSPLLWLSIASSLIICFLNPSLFFSFFPLWMVLLSKQKYQKCEFRINVLLSVSPIWFMATQSRVGGMEQLYQPFFLK